MKTLNKRVSVPSNTLETYANCEFCSTCPICICDCFDPKLDAGTRGTVPYNEVARNTSRATIGK